MCSYKRQFDLGDIDDLITYTQAMQNAQMVLWQKAMEEKLNSMYRNKLWALVTSSSIVKPIGYKWVYKTKMDATGRIERYKARLIAKGFT